MGVTDPTINNPPWPANLPTAIVPPSYQIMPGQSMMGHQQKVPAGKAITGVMPDSSPPTPSPGSPGVQNNLIKWALTNDGGLFDFGSQDPLVAFLDLDVGDSASCVVSIVNLADNNSVIAGEATRIYSGSGVINYPYPIRLLPRQAIKVVASASTSGMVLRVKAVLAIAFRG